jgi:hypothetical protein
MSPNTINSIMVIHCLYSLSGRGALADPFQPWPIPSSRLPPRASQATWPTLARLQWIRTLHGVEAQRPGRIAHESALPQIIIQPRGILVAAALAAANAARISPFQ